MAAGSKAWVCGSSFCGTAGSNPGGDVDVSLLRMLYVVRWKFLRRADLSSIGVQQIAVCL